MTGKKPHIYFRADASYGIGYGHFIRSLALADVIGDDFERTFVTRNPTPYQIQQMEAVCDNYIALKEDHLDAFLEFLHKGDLVVLDNYFFKTEYQRKIKAKGAKLVCIDDMHDKHYLADVVINHGLNDHSLFDVEPYTILCLGLEWALLRKPFLNAKPLINREIGHCVVCFGGSDALNFTAKICQILAQKKEITKITTIVGDAYAHHDSLAKIAKVDVQKHLSAQEMADLFCSVEFAVLPSSTVCMEAIVCSCPVISGYYVDNQIEGTSELAKKGYIFNIGNWLDKDIERKLENYQIIQPQVANFQVEQNYKTFFKTLNEYNKYDVTLEKLSEQHLEMVRNWRNDPKISQHMVSQEIITTEQQQNWFKSYDFELCPHFVIKFKDTYVGLCSTKRNGYNDDWCETGMYIYRDEFLPALVAFRAALAQLDYCFEIMKINKIKIYVKAENNRAHRFNETLGYIKDEKQEDHQYIYYTLNKEQYLKNRPKVTRFLR